jgi:hypothetical protein
MYTIVDRRGAKKEKIMEGFLVYVLGGKAVEGVVPTGLPCDWPMGLHKFGSFKEGEEEYPKVIFHD